VHGNEGDGTWNACEILGHLIEGERSDWMPRVRIVLNHGEARPFEPFDRFAQEKVEKKPPEQLLEEFERLRRESLAALCALELSKEDLALRGTHPACGPVTLEQLLATWVIHDLTHLHQLARVMAHPYRELVGPWKAYLGVLHCAGHSAP
jgi:hypothetical protein